MYKSINPYELFTWSPKESPETVFYFTAYAGPIIPEPGEEQVPYLVKLYLNSCIQKVENIVITIKNKDGYEDKEFEVWEKGVDIKVDWTRVLHSTIQNSLFVEISNHSKLTPSEERDLK